MNEKTLMWYLDIIEDLTQFGGIATKQYDELF